MRTRDTNFTKNTPDAFHRIRQGRRPRRPHRAQSAIFVLALCGVVVNAVAQTGDLPSLSASALQALPAGIRAALERAQEEARSRPRDASAIGRLGMMLHAYEQHHLAAACYEQASRLDPTAFEWPYLAGVAHAESGNTRAAIDALNRALALDPEHLAARMRRAAALFADGDLPASRAAYDALVRSFPEMALAHYGFGRVLAAVGDAAARSEYERAVELVPQFGRAHYALAMACRDAGLPDCVRHHLDAHRRFGSRQPAIAEPLLDEIRSMTGTARELLARGARLAAEGRIEQAIALHLEALEADPGASQAHVNLISLYGRIGRTQEASRHYRSALRLDSNLAEAHYNYGVLHAAGARYPDAADAFQHALEVDPFHPKAHKNLGALLARQQKYEEAATHYRQALSADPHHDSARFGLGEVLVALKRPREAIPHFEKLLLLDSQDSPRHRYALARAFRAAGESVTAVRHAEEALRDATRLGQPDLAARIERELAGFKAGMR